MKAFVFDGGICHVAPEMFDANSNTRAALRAKGIDFLNEEEMLRWVANKDLPRGARYSVVDVSEIPAKREERVSWKTVRAASANKTAL